MTGPDSEILWEATFDPRVRTYWLISGALILTVTVVGIVLLPFWFLLGNYFTGRYLSHMQGVLTGKTLRVAKGMFVRQEKTVPLDKITDLGLSHGPIMRRLGLRVLTVETAGQSAQGALVRLIGVERTEEFREAVLAQRDRVIEARGGAPAVAPASPAAPVSGHADALLVEIRDLLRSIDGRLTNRD